MTVPNPPPCPVCGRESIPQSRPFCSPRCAQIDLGRWLTEQYRLPATPAEDAGDEDGEP
ncbi:MAG TPA: DNA gyrase inhibitor YacG [Acetobacteraceae bacterium]|nr:DNA gyrase inhibitor YacG [Acetobacteraceae bacterium]